MPDYQFHRQQAAHNEEFLASVDWRRFPDWATTVLFYSAVHLWRGYAAAVHNVIDHRSHSQVTQEMDRDPQLPGDVREAYEELKDRSVMARYLNWTKEPAVLNVQGETLPLYRLFQDWVISSRKR